MSKNVRFQFILTYTVTDEQKAAAVAAVSAALADGALRVGEEHGLPLTRFRLEETGAAHDAVQAGAVGKVLIDVAVIGAEEAPAG
jgi:NADPH2:quinone reductase